MSSDINFLKLDYLQKIRSKAILFDVIFLSKIDHVNTPIVHIIGVNFSFLEGVSKLGKPLILFMNDVVNEHIYKNKGISTTTSA